MRERSHQKGLAAQGEGHGGDSCISGAAKKGGRFSISRKRKANQAAYRRRVIELISQVNEFGAGQVETCIKIVICLLTLKRCQKAFLNDLEGMDRREGGQTMVPPRLNEE